MLIFLYGTLKRGGVNHALVAGQRFLGDARTRVAYRLYQLDGYPGLVPAPSGGRSIEGEVWEVDSACLVRLDRFEGVGQGLYRREQILLLSPFEGLNVEAYVYAKSVAGRADLGSRFP